MGDIQGSKEGAIGCTTGHCRIGGRRAGALRASRKSRSKLMVPPPPPPLPPPLPLLSPHQPPKARDALSPMSEVSLLERAHCGLDRRRPGDVLAERKRGSSGDWTEMARCAGCASCAGLAPRVERRMAGLLTTASAVLAPLVEGERRAAGLSPAKTPAGMHRGSSFFSARPSSSPGWTTTRPSLYSSISLRRRWQSACAFFRYAMQRL
mmetsp:Transcript_12156/g.24706  ORF Transcript_12156/g.24706 Transcript_12156/m.24706 type:complete len:208 (+) Transcript_12156:158-781(+)